MRQLTCLGVVAMALIFGSEANQCFSADRSTKLGDLLGVTVAPTSAPATASVNRPKAAAVGSSLRHTVAIDQDDSSLSELRRHTPRFPLLRKLIKLYIILDLLF